MLRKLKELLGTEQRPPRQCEACGQPFICGASLKGCWCFQVKLSAEVRQQMRERYQNCLCPACLERFAELSAHWHSCIAGAQGCSTGSVSDLSRDEEVP